MFVAWLITVTDASGMPPPVVSRTVPVTVALGACAGAVGIWTDQQKTSRAIAQAR
jgi:hypothetical protein